MGLGVLPEDIGRPDGGARKLLLPIGMKLAAAAGKIFVGGFGEGGLGRTSSRWRNIAKISDKLVSLYGPVGALSEG